MNYPVSPSQLVPKRPAQGRNLRAGVQPAICGFLMILTLACVAESAAQDRDRGRRGGESFDVVRYLKRADRNEDGLLDERELGGRLKEYVEGLGLNLNRPVKVDQAIKAYEAQQQREADAKRMQAIDERRQVPKFGTGEDLIPPPDFSGAGVVGAEGRLEDVYEEEFVQQVRSWMERLDENKDGWLDEDESRRVRRFLGDDADTDENGKLGEMEVAAALKKRESEGGGRGRGRGGRGDSEERGGRGDRGERSEQKTAESSNREERSSRSFTGSSSAAESSTRSSRSMTGRYSGYVDGLMKKYDEDKNGKLSKEEQTKISGSVKLVDVDGDGEIDRQEALDSVAGNAKPAAASDSESDAPRSERRSRRRSSDASEEGGASASSRSGRGAESDINYDVKGFQNVPIEIQKRTDQETDLERRGADRDFLSRDKNTDGQISMGEFRDGKDWTDKLVRQFQSLDENTDGVITLEEFKANFNSRDFDD